MVKLNWFIRQVFEIREGGFSVFLNKMIYVFSVIKWPINGIWAIPGVMIIRLLRPFILVRMTEIWSDRIGHFSTDSLVHLSRKILKLESERIFDLYTYSEGKICNQQWAKMVRRHLPVFWWVKYLLFYNQLIPKGKIHNGPSIVSGRDYQGLIHRSNAKLEFTCKEELDAKSWMRNYGWSDGEPFVCIAVRDSKYLAEMSPSFEQGLKLCSYHNYRDGDIEDYYPVVHKLLQKGYWVVRMGKTAYKPMLNLPRVIDYPFVEDQADLLDIWLCANCHFFISTGLGIDSVATCYSRPQVYVNTLPMSYLRSIAPMIVAPKHLTWVKTGEYLNLSEHWIHRYQEGDLYEQAGICVSDLTPEEITEIVFEMDQRIDGSWEDKEEDLLSQRKFWDTFKRLAQDPNIFNEFLSGLQCKGWVEPKNNKGDNFAAIHGWKHPEARVACSYLRKMGDAYFE